MEKAKRTKSHSRKPYDSDSPDNWTTEKLSSELLKVGIKVPPGLGKATLKKLYMENKIADIPNTSSESDATSDNGVSVVTIPQAESQPSQFEMMMQMHRDMLKLLSDAKSVDNDDCNYMQKAMAATKDTVTGARGTYGVSPDMLPHMDIVSSSVKKAILQGKDINLSMLLITGFEINKADKEKGVDKRLQEKLNISEFLTAFGKYKRIMGDAYPDRKKELDLYEGIIIGIHNSHGDAFYDYHKLFSAKCAEALKNGIKVDWSLMDMRVYGLVTAGRRAKSCDLCSSVAHATGQCDRMNNGSNDNQIFPKRAATSQANKDNDVRGRKRVYVSGKELCNNFNEERGCSRSACPFSHTCRKCKSLNATHSATTCKSVTD